MRVMINATGCPAPVSDRASMKSQARISHLIASVASAFDHDLHTPVYRGGRCANNSIALRISLSSVPFGSPLWASLSAFYRS